MTKKTYACPTHGILSTVLVFPESTTIGESNRVVLCPLCNQPAHLHSWVQELYCCEQWESIEGGRG